MRRQPLLKEASLKSQESDSVIFSCKISSYRLNIPAFQSLAASAYDNLAVANVTSEPLNMRTKPSTDGEIVGKCYRGAGGTVLEKKDGWTKVRSGKIEGWMSDKYLLFGADIEPLAKELGLLSAKIMQCVAPLGSVYQAGTLSGNPCAVAAGIETIRQIESIPS